MSSATGDPSPPAAPRRLAVLGADGFIGSRVVRAALEAGAHVTAICVRPPWRLDDVDDVAPLRTVRVPGGRWWETRGLDSVAIALAGADALVLLAYEAPESRLGEAALEHERRVNAAGAQRVAGIAAELGLRVVFASSADVYGAWCDDPVRESTEPRPCTPYAIAKAEAEHLVANACQQSRGAVSVRLSTVFGPREHSARAIPAFMRALAAGDRPVVHGDGGDVRDYVYVDDAARALVNCALDAFAFSAVGRVVNVGSGIGRSTLDVLHAVGAMLGVDPVPVHVPSAREPSRLVLEPTRARCGLGFENRTAFEKGLQLEAAVELAEVPAA